MTTLDLVRTIGDVLTQIDLVLANPNFPNTDPQWQQTYALRKHLDDQQRQLVATEIDDSTAQFQQATAQLKSAADALKQIGTDITQIASLLNFAATIASIADQVLGAVK